MHQLSMTSSSSPYVSPNEEVSIPPLGLQGTLRIPKHAKGLVIFAHGSGSSRFSPRNAMVADAFNEQHIATLLFDLLKPHEENQNNRAKVFDISLLADRLVDTVRWVDRTSPMRGAPIGLFGANTGTAAALLAATKLKGRIAAVVSRGGRPDLAGATLPQVTVPTMLIAGGSDHDAIELNDLAYTQIRGPKKLVIVPGATQLFSEAGALEQVMGHAGNWFKHYLAGAGEQLPTQTRCC